MKRRITAFVLAGLATAALAGPARAAPATACSVGGLQVCAAVNVSVYGATGNWHVKLTVWNLFTSNNLNGIYHRIVGVGVGSDNFAPTSWSLVSAMVGTTNVSGPGGWKKSNPNGNGVGAEFDLFAQAGGNKGLLGCGLTAGGYPTCYNDPAQALVLDFSTGNDQLDVNDPSMVYGWHSGSIAGQNGPDCSVWVDSDGHMVGATGDCPSVVPEPASLLLLGSGLFGLSGLRLLRRKPPEAGV